MNDYNKYDFDTVIERKGTGSLKWDKYKNRDVIPLWVADMDFKAPPPVITALQSRISHGVFGYSLPSQELNDFIAAMLDNKYGWQIQPSWIVWLPGLVTGINLACRAVGDPGDEVLTAIPVYPPFLTAPGHSQRQVVKVPLAESNNHWEFDFDRIQQALSARSKLFLLCNPHNPVGRLFRRSELEKLAAICQKHDIIICSDEIHCDLILDEDKAHMPTAGLDPEIAKHTITLMSASKTYNLPGLGCAFAIISEERLRRRFRQVAAGIVPMVNCLGYEGTLAAFRDCIDWHRALLDYLRHNRDLIAQTLQTLSPLSMAPVEATYLAWIDIRSLGLQRPLQFFEEIGVGIQAGEDFDGPGFVRFNFGCPRSVLQTALSRISSALAGGAAPTST